MKTYVEKEQLERWCAQMFINAGIPEQDAKQTAYTMIRTDCRGIRTHGATRMASYLEKIKSGEINAQPKIKLEQLTDSSFNLKADGALGQVAMSQALDRGLELIKNNAVVVGHIYECGHLGALAAYALEAAEANVFCLLMQRTPPLLALKGFDNPAVGNNPLAYGCPIKGQAPLVFDMACSVAARGHVLLKSRQQQAIPADWALNKHGEPTTDADEALQGALLPSAGHKGLGLAMLVECLVGGLTATPESISGLKEHTSVPLAGAQGRQNAFLLLINPQYSSGVMFGEYMSTWAKTYHKLAGAEGRLPGSRGAELEQQIKSSGKIDIEPALYQELKALGQQVGLAFPS